MPHGKLTFETARSLALALPGVEEGTTYGNPALKWKGKLLAWVPTDKAAETNSLAIKIDPLLREDLTRSQPQTYYFTPHYADYPIVLIRLARISRSQLRE